MKRVTLFVLAVLTGLFLMAGEANATLSKSDPLLENYPQLKDKSWAEVSKARADCLSEAVDAKIELDILVGQIRDFGNVREAGLCGDELFEAYRAREGRK